jgi:type I restriction enzyme M protein
MRKDKGLNGDLDRLPQLTWLMFLKFLDDVEKVREAEVAVAGKSYTPLIDAPYRWRDWASDPGGMTGDELTSFVNNDESVRPDRVRGPGLLAYLKSLESNDGRDTRDVIANVFRGVANRMLNGYLLRDVINKINGIDFSSSKEIHDLSFLYESLLQELRDAAGDSGEFYTPRPLVRFMVRMVDPRLGETVLDPAAGTGGFLVESFIHIGTQCKTAADFETVQRRTISGIEAKSLPYLLCQMNLLLHGVESPNVDPLNALRHPLHEIGKAGQVDVVLTNPPFGGEEEKGIQSNFPEDKQTNETALLFLQLIMRRLRRSREGKKGGRCGIVVPNGTLFAGGVAERIRKEIVEEFNLHTIIRLPEGVFAPYTDTQTNLLFFDHGVPTTEIWYYELPLPVGRKKYTKTRPLQFEEFSPLIEWWSARQEGPNSWKVNVADIASNDYNLDIINPLSSLKRRVLNPDLLLEGVLANYNGVKQLVREVGTMRQNFEKVSRDTLRKARLGKWEVVPLGSIAEVSQGGTPSRARPEYWNGSIPWLRSGEILNNVITDSRERITELGLKKSSTRLLPPGTILLAMTGQGATRGRTALLGVEACTNQSCASINLHDRRILNDFLWCYLQSQYTQIRTVKHGSRQPGINTTLIKKLQVPVPSPEVQREFVAFFTNAKKRMEELNIVISNAKQQLTDLQTSALETTVRNDVFGDPPNGADGPPAESFPT